MFASSMNTCSHSHHNHHTKQKTCTTIVSNLNLYIYQLIHESTSYVH